MFDIWMANVDRMAKNILLQPYPETHALEDAREYVLYLIDHGYTGLWPVGKFGLIKPTDVPAQVVLGGGGETMVERQIRDRMDGGYRSAFVDAPPEVRQAAYDNVRAVPDELIDEALAQVPDVLMGDAERLLTSQLLRTRRDNIDRRERGNTRRWRVSTGIRARMRPLKPMTSTAPTYCANVPPCSPSEVDQSHKNRPRAHRVRGSASRRL